MNRKVQFATVAASLVALATAAFALGGLRQAPNAQAAACASSVKQVALIEDVFKSNGVTVLNALDLVGHHQADNAQDQLEEDRVVDWIRFVRPNEQQRGKPKDRAGGSEHDQPDAEIKSRGRDQQRKTDQQRAKRRRHAGEKQREQRGVAGRPRFSPDS